jgi:N-acetylglutamate synthase-like GNAT family acetyltransferase
MNKIETRKAVETDLDTIKQIADSEKNSLGFITRATIVEAIRNGQVMVVTVNQIVVGFQHYYHRKRDLQTTLYHKAVLSDKRGQGLGIALVDAVVVEARSLGRKTLLLKCPIELPSNAFHEKYGFKKIGEEIGKRRKLNIWQYLLK